MRVDLHNWETIEELVRAEYDTDKLAFRVSQEMGDTLCGAVYYRTGRSKSVRVDNLLYATLPSLQHDLIKERRKAFMPCAISLVRDHVRPCV